MAHRCPRLGLRRIRMNLHLIGGTASDTGAASQKKPHRNQHKLMHTPPTHPFVFPERMIPQCSIFRKKQNYERESREAGHRCVWKRGKLSRSGALSLDWSAKAGRSGRI